MSRKTFSSSIVGDQGCLRCLGLIAYIVLLSFPCSISSLSYFSGSGGSGKTFTARGLVQQLLEQIGGGLDSDICKVCVQYHLQV